MIPSVYILPTNLTSRRWPDFNKFATKSKKKRDPDPYDSGVLLELPTAHSACLGGKELFQRLYMETMLYKKKASFTIDIKQISESHGDN